MPTVGTLGKYEDELFPGCRFQLRDDTIPLHARHCAAHGYYRGAHCPRCVLALEEAELMAQVRRVRRQPDVIAPDGRCLWCGERLRRGRREWCSKSCANTAANAERRSRGRT
jgi:hypothetical protein